MSKVPPSPEEQFRMLESIGRVSPRTAEAALPILMSGQAEGWEVIRCSDDSERDFSLGSTFPASIHRRTITIVVEDRGPGYLKDAEAEVLRPGDPDNPPAGRVLGDLPPGD